MKYRALTVSRQYGSGGAVIAALIATRKQWTLLDASLIADVARTAGIDADAAKAMDERVDSWFHEFNKSGFRALAAAEGVLLNGSEFFDATAMAELTRAVIQKAYQQGDCVIVGRGAQCVLSGKPDVFRVFIYGSDAHRLRRIQSRVPHDMDPELLLESINDQRARYIKRFYRRNWNDFNLYDLMISSDCGEQTAAETILYAMELHDREET